MVKKKCYYCYYYNLLSFSPGPSLRKNIRKLKRPFVVQMNIYWFYNGDITFYRIIYSCAYVNEILFL